MDVSETASPEDCLLKCKSNPLCEWFTYNYADRACSLTSDCLFVDETSGEECVRGLKSCQIVDANGISSK